MGADQPGGAPGRVGGAGPAGLLAVAAGLIVLAVGGAWLAGRDDRVAMRAEGTFVSGVTGRGAFAVVEPVPADGAGGDCPTLARRLRGLRMSGPVAGVGELRVLVDLPPTAVGAGSYEAATAQVQQGSGAGARRWASAGGGRVLLRVDEQATGSVELDDLAPEPGGATERLTGTVIFICG